MYPIASSTLVLYVHADAHSSKHSSKHTQSSRVQKTQESYTHPGLDRMCIHCLSLCSAAGLAARGHHVTLCGPASLSHLATQLGGGTVDVFGLEGDWERLLQTEDCRRRLNRQDLPGLLKVRHTRLSTCYFSIESIFARSHSM